MLVVIWLSFVCVLLCFFIVWCSVDWIILILVFSLWDWVFVDSSLDCINEICLSVVVKCFWVVKVFVEC